MDPVIPFGLVMLALLAAKLRSFKLWDELLELLYTERRPDWDAEGQPIGYFWRPEDPPVGTIEGMTARRKLMGRLRGEDPAWLVAGDPLHIKLVAWRLTWWGGWIGVAVAGCFALVMGFYPG